MFKVCSRRTARSQAQADLRQMRLVRNAIMSCVDAKALSHYKETERLLIEACNLHGSGLTEARKDKPNLSNVARRLIAAGVKDGGRK